MPASRAGRRPATKNRSSSSVCTPPPGMPPPRSSRRRRIPHGVDRRMRSVSGAGADVIAALVTYDAAMPKQADATTAIRSALQRIVDAWELITTAVNNVGARIARAEDDERGVVGRELQEDLDSARVARTTSFVDVETVELDLKADDAKIVVAMSSQRVAAAEAARPTVTPTDWPQHETRRTNFRLLWTGNFPRWSHPVLSLTKGGGSVGAPIYRTEPPCRGSDLRASGMRIDRRRSRRCDRGNGRRETKPPVSATDSLFDSSSRTRIAPRAGASPGGRRRRITDERSPPGFGAGRRAVSPSSLTRPRQILGRPRRRPRPPTDFRGF